MQVRTRGQVLATWREQPAKWSTTTLNGADDVTSSGSDATLVVNGTSDSANGGDGSNLTLNGNSDTGSVGAWSTVTVTGSGDQTWSGAASTRRGERWIQHGHDRRQLEPDRQRIGRRGISRKLLGATVNGVSNTVVASVYSYIVVPRVFNSIVSARGAPSLQTPTTTSGEMARAKWRGHHGRAEGIEGGTHEVAAFAASRPHVAIRCAPQPCT